jgi:hypothetical protein
MDVTELTLRRTASGSGSQSLLHWANARFPRVQSLTGTDCGRIVLKTHPQSWRLTKKFHARSMEARAGLAPGIGQRLDSAAGEGCQWRPHGAKGDGVPQIAPMGGLPLGE